jgi:hypothetical protein
MGNDRKNGKLLLDEEQPKQEKLDIHFDDDGKVRVLMIIIRKIVKMPRHLPATSRNILTLFETAEKISRAETEEDFRVAITDL